MKSIHKDKRCKIEELYNPTIESNLKDSVSEILSLKVRLPKNHSRKFFLRTLPHFRRPNSSLSSTYYYVTLPSRIDQGTPQPYW